MADFLQGLDPAKLVLAETALSFVLSPFASPPYNLPIFLFGIYAQENQESIQSLQTFTGLLGVSKIFDIIWMVRNEQSGFIKFFTVVLLLLKIPTFFAFGLALRQRGAQFGGLGIRGGDLAGATLWSGSMPGGFGARDGYQNVDEERAEPIIKPSMPVPAPTGHAPNQAPAAAPFQV
ncbi:hypothetical protein HGRIS_007908 [Hohenbuehelia grisea]|uniref:Uncharacterized protein n=1 Tax=Hohenbuehelia grisea TaxID=104357 RepID=A0ABR3J6I9_9AGAR